jgi:mono/diheme cytochrome c family protein
MEFRPMEAEQSADVTDPASRTAAGQDGERMFNRRCGVCHLGGGMGSNLLMRRVGPENALLAQRPGGVPSALTMTAVRGGLGAMPPLSRVEVTDAELEAIAAYLSEDHAQ